MEAAHFQHAPGEDSMLSRLHVGVTQGNYLIIAAEDTDSSREVHRESRDEKLSSKDIGSRPLTQLQCRPRWRARRIPRSSGKRDFQRKQKSMLPLMKRNQSPSLLLELDADESSSLLPCNLPSGVVKNHLHNIIDVLADMVSRGSSSVKYGKSFALDVMSSITNNPALLHTMLFAVMVHDRVQQGISRQPPAEIMVGLEAVRHLNREISNPRHTITDSNIWTVLTLAYSGREDRLRSALDYPRQSFLRELQSIHIYCKMEIVLEHVFGLIKMIELLGGLSKIKTPGIAQVISLAGLISACRNIQKPIFPFISHTTTFMSDGRLSVTEDERDAVMIDLGTLGTGFQHAWGTDTPNALHDLQIVIRDMCDFTIVIENHIRGRWTRRTFPEIIDQRNYVQHALMSLTSNKDLEGYIAGDSQYDSCRLASIAYAFLVIFPVPPVVGPFEMLTQQLSQVLEAIQHDGLVRPRLELHLWALFMGAIGSIGLPNHAWFLSRIKNLLQEMEVCEWRNLRTLLKSFLWHPSTNDVDALSIWTEIQQMETCVEDQCKLDSVLGSR